MKKRWILTINNPIFADSGYTEVNPSDTDLEVAGNHYDLSVLEESENKGFFDFKYIKVGKDSKDKIILRPFFKDLESIEKYFKILKEYGNLKYAIYQYEKGGNGTPHIQGFIIYKNSKRFKNVKQDFPTAHIIAPKNLVGDLIHRVGENDQRGRKGHPDHIKQHSAEGIPLLGNQIGKDAAEYAVHQAGQRALDEFFEHEADDELRDDGGQQDDKTHDRMPPKPPEQVITEQKLQRQGNQQTEQVHDCGVLERNPEERAFFQIAQKTGEITKAGPRGDVPQKIALLKRHEDGIEIQINVEHEKQQHGVRQNRPYESALPDFPFGKTFHKNPRPSALIKRILLLT
ncbi:MAG: hypothetical protein LBL66_00595 [Clostridiales bacterium]|nr:hypothetical protein [Clostridiales bacterium]